MRTADTTQGMYYHLHNLLHPVRRYPGAWHHALAFHSCINYINNGQLHRMKVHLDERYGPTVRVGPCNLSYIDLRVWKTSKGIVSVNT